MEYITHHRFRGIAACGERLNVPYGTKFTTIGEFIATPEGKGICATTSEVAHRYFARNDDGQGLERGKLTHAIAYGTRRTDTGFRFTGEEAERLETKWKHFLRDDVDTILFNHAFFNAEVPELRELAADFNIKAK